MSDDEDLIRRLTTLTPARSTDATAIAFEAGRRSARAATTRWRVATVAAIALALAALPLRTRPEPMTLATSAPPLPMEVASLPPTAPLPPDNVISLREALLDHGLAGLPPLPRATSPARSLTMHELVGGDL